ncbi:MAG TPA: hypothetical protein VHR66_22880 [Gemmataceae bacterium]|jgi:biopolymer transport protein ExbD|nr:hypothetical protein [Gemmataceae bacterium]
MIERPKRSVTRFFVPLIDVMILLFCIFLLMPFVSTDSSAQPESKAKEKVTEPELPRDVKELQSELERTRREIERLKAEQASPADHVSLKVVGFDRAANTMDGQFYYFNEDKRVYLESDKDAEDLITMHRRESGKNEMLFLIVFPINKPLDRPDQARIDRWFKGEKHRFSPN